MANTYNRFQSLVGTDSITVVTITANNGDGTSNATTLSGDAITVKGESVSVGNNAFIRLGEIIRSAPNLTPTELSI